MAEMRTLDLIAEAATVADATNLFDTAQPQSVLLDVGLPDGSGIDVLRHVREHSSQCVVVVLSNYLEPETYNLCSELGADFIFSKSDEFEQAIETLCALSERMGSTKPDMPAAARVRRARLVVTSQVGMHARPAALLTKLAQYFDADIEISLSGRTVNAKSILDVMTLCAGHGAEVKVAADGPDAEEAISAITGLFESGFHESRGLAAQPAAPGNGDLILVADDETSTREEIKRILDKKGYRTLTARNGVEVVALLPAHLGDIKAVVLDLIMPEMDGSKTLSVIRRMSASLPVLAMSRSAEQAPSRGDAATAFLKKPFGTAELLPALRALLDRGVESPVGESRRSWMGGNSGKLNAKTGAKS
jgi:phosphotransferase system HPr (HPr) family protein